MARTKSSQPGIVLGGIGTTLCVILVLSLDVRVWIAAGTLAMAIVTMIIFTIKLNSLAQVLSRNSVHNRSRQRRRHHAENHVRDGALLGNVSD